MLALTVINRPWTVVACFLILLLSLSNQAKMVSASTPRYAGFYLLVAGSIPACITWNASVPNWSCRKNASLCKNTPAPLQNLCARNENRCQMLHAADLDYSSKDSKVSCKSEIFDLEISEIYAPALDKVDQPALLVRAPGPYPPYLGVLRKLSWCGYDVSDYFSLNA